MWFTSEIGKNFLLCETSYCMSFQAVYAYVNRIAFSWFTMPFMVTSQFRHFGIHCLYFRGELILFRRMMNWLWDGSLGRLQKLSWYIFYIGFFFHYTGCPRRNVPDFGRMFLILKYTDITQNTYIQSWTVTEIMAREVWKYEAVTHLLITKFILKLTGICGCCNVNNCT